MYLLNRCYLHYIRGGLTAFAIIAFIAIESVLFMII